MADMSAILKRMENLDVRDLERIRRYINSQPYKLENRKPTSAELAVLMKNLEEMINASKPASDNEKQTERINAALQDLRRFT